MNIRIQIYGNLAVIIFSSSLLLGCGDQGRGLPPAERQSNQVISQSMSNNGVVGGDAAFRDLVGSIGKQLDEVIKNSTEQQKILERTLKDYEEDRKQLQGVFGSIADRLDQVDKSISTIQNKIQEMDKKVQGLDVAANNKGSE